MALFLQKNLKFNLLRVTSQFVSLIYQTTSDDGFICSYKCNIYITSSCFVNNHLADGCKFLYLDLGGSLTLTNCTIDISITESGVKIERTPESNFINALKLFSTGNCYAIYDAVGSLTPITPSPEATQTRTINIFL